MKYKFANYRYLALCFCALTIAVTIFMFANKNYNTAAHKIMNFNDGQSAYLHVTDVYNSSGSDSLSDFFAEKDSLARMKEFSNRLHEEFRYFEFEMQPLLVKENFAFKNQCRIDYGTDIYGENDNIGISLKSAQIDQNGYNHFSLQSQIEEGRGFKSEDYKLENQAVPAILGYEYKGSVKIGDTLVFEYLTKRINVKVIGFFKKNTSTTISNQITFLDDYITIPSLTVPAQLVDSADKNFQKILYSVKNWGFIQVNSGEDYYSYKNQIDRISHQLNLKYVVNEVYVSSYIHNVSNTLQSSKGIFFITSIFLFVILSAVFIYIYLWHFERNKKAYAIRLICGCSFPQLRLRIFSEVLVLFASAFGLSVLINYQILGGNTLYAAEQLQLEKALQQTALFSGAVLLVICGILYIFINKNNIVNSIQKEDQ